MQYNMRVQYKHTINLINIHKKLHNTYISND